MDAEEAIEFVHRNMDLSALQNAYLKVYGTSSREIDGVSILCRCCLKMRHKELDTLSNIWYNLYKYGLAPDFYVLWDSIPYSFIVDWFVPMGDMASVIDASLVYCGDSFEIKDVVFSLQYDVIDGTDTFHQYTRWESQPLARLNSLYWLDKPEASNRTTLFRWLDGISLLIRR
jgi:hypothetical protein